MKKIFVSLLFVFMAQSVWADFMCDANVVNYNAIYEPNEYTCGAGYFLPAGGLTCAECSIGSTCLGGTFEYNPDRFHGITINTMQNSFVDNVCALNFPNNFYAVYEPNEYTCSAGYYLPANETECVQCLANNICSGGTYSFNETVDQGIVACTAPTPYAPTGSTVCYQHILHVGNDNVYLRSTKLTTPSLNIQIGNDIFYANMTTTPTYMNKDSSHYLHILYEGVDYYVCDDTTYGE